MVVDGAIRHNNGVDFQSVIDEGVFAELKTTSVTGSVSHFNKALENSAEAVATNGGHTLLFYVYYMERNNMLDGSGGEPNLTSLEKVRLEQVIEQRIKIKIIPKPLSFTPYE